MFSTGTSVLSDSLAGIHALALAITTISCVCIAGAVFLHYRRLKGAIDDYRQLALLALITLLIFGLDGIVDFCAIYLQLGWLSIVAYLGFSVAAAFCSVLVCLRLPRLSMAPLSKELYEANQELASERRARSDVVETLTRLNNELEQRVLRRTEQLEEIRRRFESALASTNITVIEQDRDFRYTWVHNRPAGYAAGDILGQRPENVLSKSAADIDLLAKGRVLESGQSETIEVSVDLDGETRWFEERLEPVVKGDVITGVVMVAIDITPHKRYEQHLHKLLREITHRSKNLLAVVQGIARQTAETVETTPQFISRFSARLQALSGAHDLLVRQSWQGVELRDLIMRELESYMPALDVRVSVSGESEILGVEVAQNLALGLHEMASNAVAHGALSDAVGRVDIAWHRVKRNELDLVELTWIERDGPTVVEPLRRGFGRALIERLVPRAIEGESEIAFDTQGLRWTLRFPVERYSEPV